MIEFIIYKEYNIEIIKYIDNTMMNYNITYKVIEFDNYKKIKEYKSNNIKIYILSHNKELCSGIHIAKYIREKINDYNSIIIITSKTDKYKILDLTSNLLILNYILEENINNIKELITISINIISNNKNNINYKYKNELYNINLKDIVYIEKERDSKRCIINTKDNKYVIQGNLKEIIEKLPSNYIKCSRSYIINIEEVKKYNTKYNIITFKNNKSVSEISRNIKKELILKLKKYNLSN